MKIKMKLIISLIIFTITFGFLGYGLSANAIEFEFENQIEQKNYVTETVISRFDPLGASVSYDPIQYFPIDKELLDYNADWYCAEEGKQYGTSTEPGYSDTKVGSHKITGHAVPGGSYTTSPTGDIDKNVYYYLNSSGNLTQGNNYVYLPSRNPDKDSSEDHCWTNWVYKVSNEISFSCEAALKPSDVNSYLNGLGTLRPSMNAGMAFLLATDYGQNRSNGYREDPMQKAIWLWLGQEKALSTSSTVYKIAAKYMEYHADIENPNVSVTVLDGAGATFDGSKYKVGPLKMSSYVSASNYSVGSVNLQSVMGSNYIGGISKAVVTLKNSSGGTKKVTVSVPKSNKEFYIELTSDQVGNYDEVASIAFTYQAVHAYAKGKLYAGKQVKLKYSSYSKYYWIENSEFIRNTQGQDGMAVDGALATDETKYTVNLNIPLKTNVSISKYITQVKNKAGDGTTKYSSTERKSWSQNSKILEPVETPKGGLVTYKIDIENKSRFPVYVKVKDILPSQCEYIGYANADFPEEIRNSQSIYVEGNKTKPIYIKIVPTASVGEYTNTVEILEVKNKYNGNIHNTSTELEDLDVYKIKTYNASVEKYIYNVEHTGENLNSINTTFGPSDERSILNTMGTNEKENERKQSNPVYVEYGDRVTYKIKIYNSVEPFVEKEVAEDSVEDRLLVNFVDNLPNKYSDLKVDTGGNGTYSISGKTISFEDVSVPGNSYITITVSFIVEEYTKGRTEVNQISIESVRLAEDPNGDPVENVSEYQGSADYYTLNDYNASIEKYISSVTSQITTTNNNEGFTKEENKEIARTQYTESNKASYPVSVEKTDVVTYTIKVKNNAVTSGKKKATQVKVPRIVDVYDDGLTFKSIDVKKYNSSGTQYTLNIGNNFYSKTNGKNEIIIEDGIILNPGDYLVYTMQFTVTKSNMYLYSLRNTASLQTIANINDKLIKDTSHNENTSGKEEASDYVKLKDLVIAGTVWLDRDKDGLIGKGGNGSINGSVNVDGKPNTNIQYTAENSEMAMQGIIVKLYQDVGNDKNDANDGNPIRTTKTDANGQYTFGKDSSGKFYQGTYQITTSSGNITSKESEQRIPKATKKPSAINYDSDSTYISYYIEFEYDGTVFKSTTISGNGGTANLGSSGEIKSDGKYYIDSNAAEFTAEREQYNKDHEYISYNVAYGTNSSNVNEVDFSNETSLSFDKQGHVSYLKIDMARAMTARSFLNGQTTKYLWLYAYNNSTSSLPETEYLKYINLGLQEREEADLSLTKDLYEVKTTINGEEIIYNYDQLKTNNTKYLQDYVIKEAYGLELYESDFKYRYEQYQSDAVRAYKGKESELNIEATYKITIKNETINDNVSLKARINEIVDLYDENFIKYNNNPNETVTIKEKYTTNGKEQLRNKNIKILEAWYYNGSGTRVDLSLSNSSKDPSGKNNTFTTYGYNTLYITGLDKVELAEGSQIDVYIKYVVDKDNSRKLKIEDTKSNNLGLENIAQINMYSIWYTDNKPAAIVDNDSNAGNIGISNTGATVSPDETSYYEDNVYKTGIKVTVPTGTSNLEREISGKVWDDSRSEETAGSEYKQYYGNGMYNTNDNKKTASMMNDNLTQNYMKKDNEDVTEEKDIPARNIKVEYIEIVEIVQANGTSRYYEERIDGSSWNATQNIRTDRDGEYTLTGIIPGYYVVRYTYGDTALVNGDDNTNQVQKDMLIFNGQDYKSTQYTGVSDTVTNYDEILKGLQVANNSDARDDEIKRLETIAYSETVTNIKAETLRGLYDIISSSTVDTSGERQYTNAQLSGLKTLTDNTYMYADTVKFYIKPEKLARLTENVDSTNFMYANLEELVFNDVSGRTFNINNIDFGLEYRPETQINLHKAISSINLKTSDGTDMVKLALKTNNLGEGNKQTHEIIKEESVGLEYTQFVSNEYTTINTYNLTSEEYQGFVFVNVDDDVLQGATIEIEYDFTAENNSEVDRIGKELDDLKDRNKAAEDERAYVKIDGDATLYNTRQIDGSNKFSYTAAGTAANILYGQGYGLLLDEYGDLCRTKERKGSSYYTKYLGKFYYTGDVSNDVVSTVKFDKIIDYLDTDLVYKATNISKNANSLWSQTTDEELENLYVNQTGYTRIEENDRITFKLLNSAGIAYTTFQNGQAMTSNLLVSVDDPEVNSDISRYLMPYYKSGSTDNTNDSRGNITLTATRVISTETDTNDMEYENIAEVIQLTSQTGRRTNYATTIGNADPKNGGERLDREHSPEFEESKLESDTSSTETITLIPPTGLNRTDRIIRDTVETASIGIGVIIGIVAIVIVGSVVVGTIVKKRVIK